ncbi:MAG: guanylate kinase [Chloroflexi bacterium]|nr:MAG: guanylate kinase [Chloroflexota bacterium]PIE81294.1 MAG: guanylate kinase [Chloroflexota bacterium]
MNEAKFLYQRPSFPKLIIISGPSGVGKDTIARGVIAKNPENYYFVVTATTRPPREGEVHGYDYFFLSNDEFTTMIEEDELLEYAVVYNDFKGVPKQQIRDALDSNRDVIMRVDVQGVATIRQLIPNAITVFLMTDSEAELERRLRARHSGSTEDLDLRIATAREEMARMVEFDYCVLNSEGAQEESIAQIMSIIEAAHCAVEQTPIEL